MGDRGDLNPQHSPPQGDALPVELRPPVLTIIAYTTSK